MSKKIQAFAQRAGCVVQLNSNPKGWDGKWEWFSVDHPNCFYCGHKTKSAAYEDFMIQTFGPTASEALIETLK
jgi:hypothetical protein